MALAKWVGEQQCVDNYCVELETKLRNSILAPAEEWGVKSECIRCIQTY